MSLRPPTDGRRQPRENAFQPFPAQGALRQSDGQRTAIVPIDFLQDLRQALAPEFGDGTRHLLYCTGFDWSLRDMVRLGQRLRDEPDGANLDLWQREAGLVLDAWWAPLAAAGWGQCEFTALPRGLLLAEITHSAPAAVSATEPACDLCAGLIAGALSFVERAERHAVEVQCAALGHPVCRFVAGGSPHIDQVEAWQQQRLPADEILERLARLPDAPA
jgi:hypothetical protein